VYVANWGNGAGTTVSVIDGRTCNGQVTSGCGPRCGTWTHWARDRRVAARRPLRRAADRGRGGPQTGQWVGRRTRRARCTRHRHRPGGDEYGRGA
jgi:hypothetical protein